MSAGSYGDFQAERRPWADQERRSWADQAGAAGPSPSLSERDSDPYLDGPYKKPKYGRPWYAHCASGVLLGGYLGSRQGDSLQKRNLVSFDCGSLQQNHTGLGDALFAFLSCNMWWQGFLSKSSVRTVRWGPFRAAGDGSAHL